MLNFPWPEPKPHKFDMEHSPYSNVIRTTEMLKRFDFNSFIIFKKCLFDELECKNEKEFLCVVVKGMYHKMPHKSIVTLNNKADSLMKQQIARFHAIQEAQLGDADDANDQDNGIASLQHRTLVSTKPNDPMSTLPSDVIDNIGSFLTKRQSIRFGFLNKTILKLTQKESYLLARKYDPLILTQYSMYYLTLKNINTFHRSLPTDLEIDYVFNISSASYVAVFKSQWFKRLFSRLKSFKCNSFDILQYIPVNILFDKNSYYTFNNHCNGEYLDQFSIKQSVDKKNFASLKIADKINSFTQRVQQYGSSKSNININVVNVSAAEDDVKEDLEEKQDTLPRVCLTGDATGLVDENKSCLPQLRIDVDDDGEEGNESDQEIAFLDGSWDKFDNIRKIDKFEVSLGDVQRDTSYGSLSKIFLPAKLHWFDNIIGKSDSIKHMLCNLAGLYRNVSIGHGLVNINTMDELCQIFHKNLLSISLSPFAMINIESNVYAHLHQQLVSLMGEEKENKNENENENENITNSDDDNEINDIGTLDDIDRQILLDKLDSLTKQLNCITITLGGVGDPQSIKPLKQGSTVRLLEMMSRFGLTQNVTKYHINFCDCTVDFFYSLRSIYGFGEKLEMLPIEKLVLNKIFVENRKIHPNLDTVRITICNESLSLTSLTKIFTYLLDIRDKLLSTRNKKDVDSNGIIRMIEIEWKDIFVTNENQLQASGNIITPLVGNSSKLLHRYYGHDKEYSIDTMILEWNSCDFTLQSFGIMCQNIRHWFNRIYLDYHKHHKHGQEKKVPLQDRVLRIKLNQ